MNTLGQHILIVDDNVRNLQLTAKVLKDNGFLISLAQDGKSALQLLKTFRPNLILMDIMMPEVDGLEVCNQIKMNPEIADIPIIFLTAKDQADDLIAAFAVGGVDYITKPFRQTELLVRVRNHLELADSRQKIIEMNATRDKLYSIIAHDIRSPFAGISFTLDAINDGYIDPSSAEFKEILHHLTLSTKQTCALLDNLLEWTKFQKGSIELRPDVIKTVPLIADCIALLQPLAQKKSIKIDTVFDSDDAAFFDEVTIHTVFRNLLSNAIKFTKEGGSIHIRTLKDESYLVVELADSGIGMPPETIQKIFEYNEHVTTSGTNQELGNGLGLMMVKDFVAKNNGKIEVQSEMGVGTTFFVFLPVFVPQKNNVSVSSKTQMQ